MRSTDLGAEYEVLAQLIAGSFDPGPGLTCLYAEIEPDVISPSLFKDVGEHVLYKDPSKDIDNQLWKIWDQLDEDDRWQVIECKLLNGHFEAAFRFPVDLDPKEHVDERQPRFLQTAFGNKKVVYPSWED